MLDATMCSRSLHGTDTSELVMTLNFNHDFLLYSMQMNEYTQHDRSKIEPMAGSNIRLALFVNRQAWNHHPTMLESIGKLDQ